jgi:hypothetical protein
MRRSISLSDVIPAITTTAKTPAVNNVNHFAYFSTIIYPPWFNAVLLPQHQRPENDAKAAVDYQVVNLVS